MTGIRLLACCGVQICSVFLLIISSSAYAVVEHISDYFVETWTSTDGLPHNSINSIAQTRDGYLWFATWEGVVRYNGINFQVFDRNPQTGMADSGTRTLLPMDNNGLLVAGARGSITHRQSYGWQSFRSAPSLVNGALIDDEQNLWLAIEGLGVVVRPYLGHNHYGPDRWLLTDASAYRLVKNQHGVIFAATDKGLYRFNDWQVSAMELPIGRYERINYISISLNQELVVATDQGVWVNTEEGFQSLFAPLEKEVVTLVEQDRVGNWWVGTVNRGIARLKNQQLQFLEPSRGLPYSRVLSWYQDIEGSVWVGTNAGIMRLRDAPFININSDKGLVGDYVRTVLPLDERRVMVGTSRGLSIIEEGLAHSALMPQVGARPSILSLAKVDQQSTNVWVGTVQKGLLLWQNGQLRPVLDENNGLPSSEVRAIVTDLQDNLWIGTSNGIVKRTPQGVLTTYNKNNSPLPDDYIMALAVDSEGKLWVGSAVGVAYFDEQGKIRPVDLTKQEQAQYVFGFYMESDYVWMTTDRGIVRYRLSDNSLSLVGRAAGLPIDKFFQMLRDSEGHVWLSSNRGIWKLNYDQMLAVADGMSTQLEFEHFDEGDGMATSQANGGTNPASASLPNGELFFATAKGVASIKVQRLQQLSELRLPVVLESVSFDSESINPDQQYIAAAGTNRVSFGYVGLGFVMSERLQYRTKLEGFDRDWSYRGHNTQAEYTNLAPGKYRFFVSARYPYGEWNDATFSYVFIIEPHWWQRKEVIVMAGMLFLALAVSLVMWRIRILKRRELYLVEQVALKTQKLRLQAEKFERLSKEDDLTGLANRRAFDMYLKQAFSRLQNPDQQVSIALLDIDHFKQINDRYSHIIGDQAIVAVSQELLGYVGDKTRVARWGGEEFTILYVGDPQQAWGYFEKLRCKIEQVDLSAVAPGLNVTVSIGFADAQQAESYETVLKLADHALLTAKKLGRNRVVKSEEWQVKSGLH
ncbi:TPA: diguanylate cyclase [Vibrio cholerae]|uniref:diguanylate cyclase n=2 Tax=Vibrio cholerae TaxID=666 RepID=UPI00028D3426|nr:diguanylate cyclase [Vibrio cholerae]AOY47098.1 GGDEF family protein [Vibrio cholerae]AOY50703.1 GGDEF family protein [Vibrio cholerae]EKG68514.1 diguanylate cyclase domain protein [Vibrio cholerae CP1037(10)]MCX9578375.1 diguanylate cyclase [Vibrio cholerae]MCX9606312.1 diguanylate cyclase [Vibrio cholerae]